MTYPSTGCSFIIQKGGVTVVYITAMQSPAYHQMTLEEFLFQSYKGPSIINRNTTNTRTYVFDTPSQHFTERFDFSELIAKLDEFNSSTSTLRTVNRSELYETFYIPKKSGGLRRIDAPKPELMDALRRLDTIFKQDFHALYHTSAFAYIKGRCTIDAVKRHQSNESRWFGKYDLSDFFGSTTLDFVMKQFSMIFPFSEVVRTVPGEAALRSALELAFLCGGLPQGTPISPLITNIMMIPLDYKLSNILRNFDKQRFVYTRYADDFLVSSTTDFDVHQIEKVIVDTLTEFASPFTLNASKTRYGSSAGRNWNLGVMLNKDNDITVGHKKKRQFQSMLHNYIRDKLNGVSWDIHDVQVMDGYRSYYRMVERDAIDKTIAHINEKMNVNVLDLIRKDLK